MWNISLITPATFQATTPANLQYWTRTNLPLTSGDSNTLEYTLLAGLIDAAVEQFRNDTAGHVLCTSTWQLTLDQWSWRQYQNNGGWYAWENMIAGQTWGIVGHAPVIYIPAAPVTSINSVQYLDNSSTAGTWQTLTGWSADTTNTPARVILPASLPNLNQYTIPRVQVQYTAGYGNGSAPSLAVQGISMLAAHWYNNRESSGEAKPIIQNWDAIIGRFNTGVLGNWNR